MEFGTQRHADSRTAKHLLPESTTKSVESGTYDVICQFCTFKGMVAESVALKAQNCALSKFSLPMHSNDALPTTTSTIIKTKTTTRKSTPIASLGAQRT